jgi:hypothetical protein
MPPSEDRAGSAGAPGPAESARVADRNMAAMPIGDERLLQLHAYWRHKATGRPMPCRADLDPIEIPQLLPHVMLVDVLRSSRYRYRLIGTENAREHGINATGCYLDEVLPGPEYQAHVIGLYDECLRFRRPLYSECLFLSPGQQGELERHTKVLFLPLSDDGENINIVLVGQVFFYIDAAVRDRHFIDTRRYKEIAHVLL